VAAVKHLEDWQIVKLRLCCPRNRPKLHVALACGMTLKGDVTLSACERNETFALISADGSTSGMTCRRAATWEPSLSVIIRFGATPCFFNSRVNNRLAALVLRQF
jgi:succinylarginine dihydrolase